MLVVKYIYGHKGAFEKITGLTQRLYISILRTVFRALNNHNARIAAYWPHFFQVHLQSWLAKNCYIEQRLTLQALQLRSQKCPEYWYIVLLPKRVGTTPYYSQRRSLKGACRQICQSSDSEAIVHIHDLSIAAISVGAIHESPLHLGLDFLCVSPAREFA